MISGRDKNFGGDAAVMLFNLKQYNNITKLGTINNKKTNYQKICV